MRNPNNYGTIKKMSGKRRRPFAVYITTKYERASFPDISFLEDALPQQLYDDVKAEYEKYKSRQPLAIRQVQKCIGYYETRQAAMIALADYNKNPFDIDKQQVTFKQAYDAIYESTIKHMKPSTQRSYTSAHDKCGLLDNMRLREIKLSHLQGIVDDHANMSKATQNNLLVLFHAIYNFAMENDIVEKDYSSFVKITSKAEQKQKTPFSKDEVMKIWDNVDWMQACKRNNVLTDVHMVDSVLVLLYTGLRIGELLEIKPEDVHLDERWIDVRGTKTKAAQRAVPIHKKIVPLLEKRLSECCGDYLFCGNDGEKITYARYTTMFFNLFMESLGMDHTPHECRHTFASIAAASGLNPVLLKKIIGHASSDITADVYTHAYLEDLIKEIDKFDL